VSFHSSNFLKSVETLWQPCKKKINLGISFLYLLKAGCLPDAITIALEPEAASIYCQNQQNNNFKELVERNEQQKRKTKYLVVDIGGNFVINCSDFLNLYE